MLQEALDLASQGFAIHWLHPKSKRPIGNDWAGKPVSSVKALEASHAAGNNVGVRTGKWSKIGQWYLHIIDVDVREAADAPEAMKKLKEMLPELDLDSAPTVISGSGGESRHFYLLTTKAFPPKKFAHSPTFKMVWDEKLGRDVKKWDWELHLLGTGAQAAIPPSIHPDTEKPYRWLREFDWGDVDLGLFDAVPADAIERLIGYEENETSDPERMKPIGMTIAEVRETLEDLPYEEWFEDRDGWFRSGMAIHHETSSSKEGFDLWCEYSAKSKKFDLEDAKRVWKSFKNRTGKPFRMASLNSVVRDIRVMRDFDEVDEDDDLGFEEVGEDSDDFDDVLGYSKHEEKKSPSKSQRELAKRQVEHALGAAAPKWVKKLNAKHSVARVSSKTVIMDFHPDGRVTYGSVTDLHNFYENDRRPQNDTTVPVTKQWMQSEHRRSYPNGIIFSPNKEVEGAYNHWQGFSVDPSDSKDPSRGCKLFLRHLLDVVCCGNEAHYRYHLGWLAHMIQKPEDKPGVAIVYKGRKRIGKDTVFEYVGRLIKNHYITIANQDQMLGKFNQHQERCLLLHMQEGFWAGSKQAEGALKYLITSNSVMIEPKGMNAFPIPSVLRLFISSNERWVIPATEDEGRFFVMNVSEKRRNDHVYFAALREEMEGDGPAALLAYLQQYDISNFQVRAVPDTEALAEQKVQGLKNVERWWLDTLQRGQINGIQNREDGVDGAVWMSRSVQIDSNEFRDNYSHWMRSRRYDGEEVSEIEFGIRIKKMLPSGEKLRLQHNRSRRMVFRMPHLEACRKEFEQFLGSEIAWPDDELDVTIIPPEGDDL